MRENFRPQLQVCSRLEYGRLRRVHDNGIGFMHEQIEATQSFDTARLLPNKHPSSKTTLVKEENLRVPNPLVQNPLTAERSHVACDRSRILIPQLMWRSPYLSATARCGVCLLCELLHVRKKPLRLADEKTHGSEECESPRGGAFRVRWSNDRNNREVST